jgi:hypothetical protein
MSSLLRTFAQVPTQVKYLYAIENGTGLTPTAVSTAVATYRSQVIGYDGTILNTRAASTFLGNIGTTSFTASDTFVDMGKSLYIQTSGRDIYRFRLFQKINGPESSGVPANYTSANLYILIWSADPATKAVVVSRTG